MQSGTYDPDFILSVMNEFLDNFYHNDINQLTSEEKFSDTKSSYIEVINQKDLTLKDKTTFLWNFIALKSYQFDIHSQVIEIVHSITGDELRNFYNDNILQSSQRRLVISIFGYNRSPHYINNATQINYDQIGNFKSNASYFRKVNCWLLQVVIQLFVQVIEYFMSIRMCTGDVINVQML